MKGAADDIPSLRRILREEAGALRLLPHHQAASGVLLGLATIKPQLGLLIPLALLAAGLDQAQVEHWFCRDLCGEMAG